MYGRQNLGWDTAAIANFLAGWGGAVSACGMFVAPYLLKQMSARTYTTFANCSLLSGIFVWGLAARGEYMFYGLPLIAPGVNGNSTHAVKGLAGTIAVKHGLGRGEWSAWLNNMRSISVSVASMIYSYYYGWCNY